MYSVAQINKHYTVSNFLKKFPEEAYDILDEIHQRLFIQVLQLHFADCSLVKNINKYFFSQLTFSLFLKLIVSQLRSTGLPSFDLEPHWRDISKLSTKYFCYIITMRVPLKYKKND